MKKVMGWTKILPLIVLLVLVGLSFGAGSTQASAGDVVLYASESPKKVGNWSVVSDSTAAGGARLANSDKGAAKISNPLANPKDYFEMSFDAEAGQAYRLWLRGKAQNDHYNNDSVYVQFSGSVSATGTAVFRIGTTSATTVALEGCSGCGLNGWGWEDNGWNGLGPLIYFQTTGVQTIRVQVREDGLSVDQILLSPLNYLIAAPGTQQNDDTILSKSSVSSSEVVIWANDVQSGNIKGNWAKVIDSTSAGQVLLRNPDRGASKISTPLANPADYFEVSFNADAGKAYRLWMRSRAEKNHYNNDSVYVQFSGSVTATGSSVFRIGTTSATTHAREGCNGCGLSGWGWEDNGWNGLGPLIYFSSTGQHTMRVQVREDGLSIDQIVLSPVLYLSSAPGSAQNDDTILDSTLGSQPPPSNQPPQVSISASPSSGTAPLSVNFTSSASDPDGFIESYSWNFGDGNTSSQVSPSHTYQSSGSYTARLTVTDNAGATASVSTTISVNAPSSGGTGFRVMSFNIAGGIGTDSVRDLNRTATYIADRNPDIVALCQVEDYSSTGHQYILLRDMLTQKTGVTWYATYIRNAPGIPSGNAILSKYPFSATSTYQLSHEMSVVRAKISINGKVINFFSTHLDWRYQSYRLTQISELKQWMSTFAEPRIVAGDFNHWPDVEEYFTMRRDYFDGWQENVDAGTASAYPDNPVGWNTRTRKGRLDYIYLSKGATKVSINKGQTPDIRDLDNTNVKVKLGTLDDKGVRPSDHNLVVVDFTIK